MGEAPQNPRTMRLPTAPQASASLSPQRRFVTPAPNEGLEELARRALPGEHAEAAALKIKSWNTHIFVMRKPAGLLLGSDVVFIEPPRS